MRIAIIAPPWLPVPPPAYGGTEAVLDTLARGLRAIGHDVLLYTTGDSTCEVERGWLHATAPGTAAIGQAAEEIERHHVEHAYKAAIEWNADVVHDHTLLGPACGQRLAVPVVTTNHGPFEGGARPALPLHRRPGPDHRHIAASRHERVTPRSPQSSITRRCRLVPLRGRRRRLRAVPRTDDSRQGRPHRGANCPRREPAAAHRSQDA